MDWSSSSNASPDTIPEPEMLVLKTATSLGKIEQSWISSMAVALTNAVSLTESKKNVPFTMATQLLGWTVSGRWEVARMMVVVTWPLMQYIVVW